MRTVIRYAIYAFVIGLACAILSFALLYGTTNPSRDNLVSFSGNLLLNVVAEFLGLAVGGIFAALIAKRLAKKKLEELAPYLVRLIGQLRIGGTISKEAARDSVVCAVHVISEDSLDKLRSKKSGSSVGKQCLICNLTYDIETIPAKGIRCKHCKLDAKVWENKELEEALVESTAQNIT